MQYNLSHRVKDNGESLSARLNKSTRVHATNYKTAFAYKATRDASKKESNDQRTV